MLRLRVTIAIALFAVAADRPVSADEIGNRFPGSEWDRTDPAAVGWSSDTLRQAEALSKTIGSTAVMVIHRGAVVAEWGDTAAKTPLASVRKSLLSALIGNAVARGEIDLKKTIGELGIDDNEPSLSPEEKTATVRELLEARSGVYHAALFETASMAAQRPPRHSHPPGAFWYYNNWDFNTLGTIYEHATRHSIFDAFATEIAGPIGMQDYRPTDGVYVTGAASVYPAYPFNMSARDLARFALLYLHNGAWRDRQVVPAEWVAESTKAYSQPTSEGSVGATGIFGGSASSTISSSRWSNCRRGRFSPWVTAASSPSSSRPTILWSFIGTMKSTVPTCARWDGCSGWFSTPDTFPISARMQRSRRRRANRSTVARSSNSSPVRRCDMAMVPPADPTESDWTMMAVRRRCVDQTASSSIRESGMSKAIAYAEIGKRPNRCMRAGRPSTRASMLLSSMATA